MRAKFKVGDRVYLNNKGEPWTVLGMFGSTGVLLSRVRRKYSFLCSLDVIGHQRVDAGPRTL